MMEHHRKPHEKKHLKILKADRPFQFLRHVQRYLGGPTWCESSDSDDVVSCQGDGL